MKAIPVVAAVVIGCAILFGCDGQPGVLFVADGSPIHLLQLTGAQEDCATPRRVCYLTSWEGGTSRGCWIREHGYIHARFADQEDKLVPVGEFRRTQLADYQNASLD